MQLSGWQAYFLGSIRVNGLGLIDLAQTVDSHARNLKLGGLSGYLSLSLSLTHTHTYIRSWNNFTKGYQIIRRFDKMVLNYQTFQISVSKF
jgi:hypothetical protein